MGPDIASNRELASLFPPVPHELPRGLRETPAGGDPGQVGGDRASLALRPIDEEIIKAVAGANRSTVVTMVAAGAVLTESWRARVPALLMMWYAGMEGGHALADVLTGARNPSGRLPFSVPTTDEHLPFFDRDATAITYDRFHGQRLLDKLGAHAAFPHGFGLSYTTFEIRHVELVQTSSGGATLSVEVANIGPRDGGHVVQVYGSASRGPYAGEQFVVGFAPAFVRAGSSARVAVEVSLLPLAAWDATSRHRVLPAIGDVELEVGAHAHDPRAAIPPRRVLISRRRRGTPSA